MARILPAITGAVLPSTGAAASCATASLIAAIGAGTAGAASATGSLAAGAASPAAEPEPSPSNSINGAPTSTTVPASTNNFVILPL